MGSVSPSSEVKGGSEGFVGVLQPERLYYPNVLRSVRQTTSRFYHKIGNVILVMPYLWETWSVKLFPHLSMHSLEDATKHKIQSFLKK